MAANPPSAPSAPTPSPRTSATSIPSTTTTTGRSLAAGALSGKDVVIMALASSGPTQSVAVSLAAILATVAYAGFLPILICFIPMLGIALGYQRLNAWHTSAGATYSWVGRALNPHAGFLAGWLMLMYYTVGTTSLTVPLGTYFLSFFSDSAANNQYAVAAVGSAFDPAECPVACQQLTPGSSLLAQLGASPAADRPPWLSLWTEDDQTVRPPDSARLPGAVNVPLQSICPTAVISHTQLPTAPLVDGIVLRTLAAGRVAPPAKADCVSLEALGASNVLGGRRI